MAKLRGARIGSALHYQNCHCCGTAHSAECLQLSEESDRFACYQNRFDKPHRSAGATQAAPLGEEQRLLMGSHHEGDETKGSIHSSVRDYIEARKASRSVRTAGPKDLTVTVHWPNSKPWSESQSQGPPPLTQPRTRGKLVVEGPAALHSGGGGGRWRGPGGGGTNLRYQNGLINLIVPRGRPRRHSSGRSSAS